MRQGELSFATYHSTLTHPWQQLDTYRTHKPYIPEELVTYQKDTENERVYEFLAGLNPKFDQIQVQVLGIVQFPTLREAYNMVQHEETHRNSMLPSGPPDRSALVTMSRPSLFVPDSINNQVDKVVRHCDHCNKDNHTRETCFKLHGEVDPVVGVVDSILGVDPPLRPISLTVQLVLIQLLFLILLQSYPPIRSVLFSV
ncbi:hypothetical protein CFOL_v3_31721 [Cephalotus follicularis]|uniref:UBN2_3 domain-containing protein n=1 Tax=Cephalotus follicularis TaxID=3775 RepID=A0A1Q3D7R1_CEPFO|nr:hypothetical protein CFOL_v3_31721 [Cephalotus follicularis]